MKIRGFFVLYYSNAKWRMNMTKKKPVVEKKIVKPAVKATAPVKKVNKQVPKVEDIEKEIQRLAEEELASKKAKQTRTPEEQAKIDIENEKLNKEIEEKDLFLKALEEAANIRKAKLMKGEVEAGQPDIKPLSHYIELDPNLDACATFKNHNNKEKFEDVLDEMFGNMKSQMAVGFIPHEPNFYNKPTFHDKQGRAIGFNIMKQKKGHYNLNGKIHFNCETITLLESETGDIVKVIANPMVDKIEDYKKTIIDGVVVFYKVIVETPEMELVAAITNFVKTVKATRVAAEKELHAFYDAGLKPFMDICLNSDTLTKFVHDLKALQEEIKAKEEMYNIAIRLFNKDLSQVKTLEEKEKIYKEIYGVANDTTKTHWYVV